ncbi:MAG: hypothetical protein V1781_04655, partial [Bacteroidota bacterium]
YKGISYQSNLVDEKEIINKYDAMQQIVTIPNVRNFSSEFFFSINIAPTMNNPIQMAKRE